jgi:Calpain family cysteine protease
MSLSNGLAMSHAYAILGVFNLTDASGKTVYQLVWIRNPWRVDGYTGPWNDNDPLWTSGVNGVDYRK